MSAQRFKSTIATAGSKAYVVVPFDPREVWGKRDRYYVKGSVGGCGIRGLLMPDAGQFVIRLGAAWLRDNDVPLGVNVDVVLAPDGPQSDALAPDIAAVLDTDARAAAFFQSVAPFYRKNFIRWIESAKRPETRAARIAEMMGLLRAGKREK